MMGSANTKLLKLVTLFLLFSATTEQNECSDERCSKHGPAIRFPFRLKGIQPQNCSYSTSFDLSCTEDDQTLLQLPTSAKFFVRKIDYKSQTIHLADPEACLPRLIRNVNLSASVFNYTDKYIRNYTVFYCESEPDFYSTRLPSCLSASGQILYAVSSQSSVENVISCAKLYDLVSIPSGVVLNKKELVLSWYTPKCSVCETRRKRCRLKSNTTGGLITECYGAPISETKRKLVISALVVGPFLVTVVAFALYCVYQKSKTKEENQVKIEKFLADYDAFKPTRYSYVDIKRITNQFSDELGQGTYGTVFKGKLSEEIPVAVKVLNDSNGRGQEFINEVEIISKIHHVNVVRMVGFCADGFRRALVYEYLPYGSLQKFISPSDPRGGFLSWEKMKDIALGVAKGIEYLHQGCEQRIVHFDIKPHNILLDQNFNPKVSDFGTAKLCSKDQSVVSMTAARGTVGYIAPEVFSRNFGDVSYKSDNYSFGMLLLEMVGSKRKNRDVPSVENASQFYLPEWIYKHFERGEDLEIDIGEEEDVKTANRLAIVGLRCIQWQPADRPSINAVVRMLEGKEELSMPSNPFAKGPVADL